MIEAELQRFLSQSISHEEVAVGSTEIANIDVIAIHSAPLHELLVLAAQQLGENFNVGIYYAPSVEKGIELAQSEGIAFASVFVEFSQVRNLEDIVSAFGTLSDRLQQVVAIIRSDYGANRFESLGYHAHHQCLQETTSPSEFIASCRALLLDLRLRSQVLESHSVLRSLLPLTSTLDDLHQATTPLIARLSATLGVDALLAVDLKSRASEISAIMSDEGRIRPILRRVARREQAKLNASQEAEMRLLSSLLSSEVSSKLDSENSTIRFSEFSSLEVDGLRVFVIYAYAMHDSLVSALVVAPHEGTIFHSLVFAEFRAALESWARHHERLTMKSLRERLEAEGTRARGSLQDSLTEIVCGVSHEINTPLGIIRTASAVVNDLANEFANGELERDEFVEELNDASKMIDGNILRLGELVERFKAVAVSQAPEPLSTTPVVAPIDHAINRLAKPNLIVNKVVDLDRGAEEWVGYPRRLEQVIFQLLENVAQHAYRGEGGMVEVRVRGREVEGNLRYSVAVADFGAGIAEENIPRVFELFFTTSRQQRAPGLGLAVTQSLVTDGMRGQIRCESQIGMGTTFTIDFASIEEES